MTILGIPTLRTIWATVQNEKLAIDFLLQCGVFDVPTSCVCCGGAVSVRGKLIRCTTKSCRKSTSLLSFSFFAKSRIAIHDCLLLSYLWVTGDTVSSAMAKTEHSPNTIVDYFRYFRQLVGDALDEEDWTIGGEGIIVEVDESKFGKRKNNRGKHVEGAWVIGGIERTDEKKFFVKVVNKRDHETIVEILQQHILPGSIVHSDCWKGYCGLEDELEVEHKTVNHSKGFINRETGVHTNSIEAKWGALKRNITLRGRVKDALPNYLLEQIWRSKNKNNLWHAFIEALKEIAY